MVSSLATSDDIASAWSALRVRNQKIVVGVLMDVTVDRSGRGRGFDPSSVRIDWKVTP